jgi:hypothetical protein
MAAHRRIHVHLLPEQFPRLPCNDSEPAAPMDDPAIYTPQQHCRSEWSTLSAMERGCGGEELEEVSSRFPTSRWVSRTLLGNPDQPSDMPSTADPGG